MADGALAWGLLVAAVVAGAVAWGLARRRLSALSRELGELRDRADRLGRLAVEGSRRFSRGVTPSPGADGLPGGDAVTEVLRLVREATGSAQATLWRVEAGRAPAAVASSRGGGAVAALPADAPGTTQVAWVAQAQLPVYDERQGRVAVAAVPAATFEGGHPAVLLVESPTIALADLKARLPEHGTTVARVLRLVEGERSVAEQQAAVRAIFEYATDFHKQRNPERLGELLCERALLLTGALRVALVRWDVERRSGHVMAVSLDHEVEPGLAVDATSLAGEACERADIVLWREGRATLGDRAVFGPTDAGRHVQTLAVVPLRASRGVIGALVAEGEGVRLVGKVAVGNLRLLATLVAPTLETLWDYEEIERRAQTDQLTGLANRRPFESRLLHELSRVDRHGGDLSLLLCDVDHFKRVNDTYGHDVGDLVLKHVAAVLKDGARTVDLVARLGGEEFAILLPSTDTEGAREVAERLRRELERRPAAGPSGLSLPVTASFGVATYPAVKRRELLVKAADEALYAAKRGGRNRVAVAAPGMDGTTGAG